MPQLPPQTPGVYINEQNAFPNSVVEVATAIPVFIGYTQLSVYKGKILSQQPTRINSLQQFEEVFGIAPHQVFELLLAGAAGGGIAPALPQGNIAFKAWHEATLVLPQAALFYLYRSVKLFYLSGGDTCYIVSVGDYSTAPAPQHFIDALGALENEPDLTLVVCPDALLLSRPDYATVMNSMLAHCGNMGSRVALLDVYGGDTPGIPPTLQGNDINSFRDSLVINQLSYGVAYFPWVLTSVTAPDELSFLNLSAAALDTLAALPPAAGTNPQQARDRAATLFAQAKALLPVADGATPAPATPEETPQRQALHQALSTAAPEYRATLAAISNYLNTLPVASAMAGVYTAVDSSRGVWKAPANVSLNAVNSPTVPINDAEQAWLSVDAATGKSINAIRTFPELGAMVWGARTLAGNSQDWRYVNVRRTLIMIEQSIKLALRAYVFEPNDANTWVTIQSMLSSFLFNLWKQGALAGAVPADAYQVSMGLGSTMTADDVLNGFMNVSIKVAIARPAEFIVLTLQQQMQSS